MTPTLDLAYWGRVAGLLAVETCVVLTVAWIADRLLRHPPHRRTVWQATLVAVGLLWLGELAGGRTLLARLASADREPPIVLVEVLDPNGPLPEPVSVTGAGIAPAPASSTTLGAWPAAIWFAVATALVARLTLGHDAMRRRRSRSLPADPGSVAVANRLAEDLGLRRIETRIWPGLRSPVAFGIRTPGIALPADFATRFSPAQREAMLAHELAHLAARDPLWLTLTGLICSLAWWHPGVWWARRRMQAHMEAAADSASALVPGGREALAESLLAFGRTLSMSSPFRGLGMAGAGHPSELARRITRLLEPDTRWRPPTGPITWLATGGALAITLLTLAIAWPGSAVEPLGPTLLARMQATPPIAPATPEATPGPQPQPQPPFQPAQPTDPSPPRTFTATGPYAQEIVANLARTERLVLREVFFPDTPLRQVTEELQRASRQVDPADEGIVIGCVAVVDAQTPDPADGTDYTVRHPGDTRIRMTQPLRNVRLRAALDAVVAAAVSPIRWEPHDLGYGIMFVPIVGPPPQHLVTRTWRVDAPRLQAKLAAMLVPRPENRADPNPRRVGVQDPQPLLADYLISQGITLDPPAAAFLSTTKGLLMFRGSPRDVEQVGEIIDRLDVATAPPTHSLRPQVTIEVRILEVPEPPPGSGTDRHTSSPSALEAFFAGIPEQDPPVTIGPPTGTMPGAGSPHAAHFRIEHSRVNGQSVVTSAETLSSLVDQLLKRKTLTQLATPKVTTLSGRAARIQVQELRTVVAGVNAIDATPTNTPSIHYITEQIPVGPTIDIIPTADNGAWRVQLTSWLSEFLGYDDPGGEVVEAWGLPRTAPLQGTLPLPHLRVREATGDAKVSPGQAMLIRGPAGDHVVRTQATWFRRAKTETHRRRVYYIVTLTP